MGKLNSKKLTSVIGVHFGARRISAVELHFSGSSMLITARGSVDMRSSYLNPSVQGASAMIGAELAALLKQIGATTNNVIFDVPSQEVFVRSFSFPDMPREEMRNVVDGEVRHANILAEHGGAFDFLTVGKPMERGDVSVLAMAADDPILWLLDDIARNAKVKLIARVPAHYAMLRALLIGAPPDSPTLYVTVSSSNTEISIVTTSGVQLYRRIDCRGADLIVQSARLEEIARLEKESEGLLQEDVPVSLQAIRSGSNGMLDPVIVQRLLTETRRSVEFLRRTQYEDAAVTRTILSITDEKWKDLQPALAEAIGVPCTIAEVKKWSGMESATDAGEYLAALGLATEIIDDAATMLPRLDLKPQPRKVQRVSGTPSGVKSALIAAGVLFIALGAIFLLYWIKSNSQDSKNATLHAQYKKLESEYLPEQEKFKAEVDAIADLATKGIPFGPIMDEMALSLDPTVGMIAATFDIGGRITLQGQAGSEEAIVNTLGKLRLIGGFRQTFVDSFEDRKNQGLIFNISTNYDLAHPARLEAEKEQGAAQPEREAPKENRIFTEATAQ